jgi:hypothetical protein
MGTTAGATGRYALHSDSRNPTDALKIEQLIGDYLSGQTAPLQSFIDELASSFDWRSIFEGTFYRGVGSPVLPRIRGDRIGPSPTPNEGRYNRRGDKALYLVDDLSFLGAELNATDFLVQQYAINLSQLRIADLTPDNTNVPNSLSLLFQAAEQGKTGAGLDFEAKLQESGKSRYLISQSLSESFIRHGWEGLHVPGVHGKAGQHYRNLVLFGHCVDSWEKWTVGSFRRF